MQQLGIAGTQTETVDSGVRISAQARRFDLQLRAHVVEPWRAPADVTHARKVTATGAPGCHQGPVQCHRLGGVFYSANSMQPITAAQGIRGVEMGAAGATDRCFVAVHDLIEQTHGSCMRNQLAQPFSADNHGVTWMCTQLPLTYGSITSLA